MSKQRMDLATVDLNTGDVKDGVFVYCPKKQHSLFSREGFVMMSQLRSDMLANSDLGLVDFRVLMKLIAILDMDNLIAINQTELANEMGLQRPNFSRSIKKLLSEEIIIEGAKLGQHKSYRLNAHYGWKGSTENHADALELDPIPLSDRMKQSGIELVIDGGKKSK
jgi:hypothetical protein